NSMASSNGVVVSHGQVIATDLGRILFWNTPNGPSDLSNGKAPGGFVGALNFNDFNPACCYTLKKDDVGHLYTVFHTHESDIFHIAVYDLPLTTGEAPIKTLSYPFDLLGGGQVNYADFGGFFSGIAPSPNSSFLWVSDNVANR